MPLISRLRCPAFVQVSQWRASSGGEIDGSFPDVVRRRRDELATFIL